MVHTSRPIKPTPTARHLDQLSCGEGAYIQRLNVDADLRSRWAALGLEAHKWISVLRKARWGGPLHVRVGTTEIILRRQEAAKIGIGPVA